MSSTGFKKPLGSSLKTGPEMTPPLDHSANEVTVGSTTYHRLPGYYGPVEAAHVQALMSKGWTKR